MVRGGGSTKDEPWGGDQKGGCGNNELEVRRALLSSHAGIVAYLYLPSSPLVPAFLRDTPYRVT